MKPGLLLKIDINCNTFSVVPSVMKMQKRAIPLILQECLQGIPTEGEGSVQLTSSLGLLVLKRADLNWLVQGGQL